MNANNNASLRDVLESIKDSIECVLHTISTRDIDSEAIEGWCNATIKRINEALAAPPRACDLMSEEELTNVVTNGVMAQIQNNPNINIVGGEKLVECLIATAIGCAYDTQLKSKNEVGNEN